MASQKGLLAVNPTGTIKNIMGNEAIIAVLSSSILSPMLVPTITSYVNQLPMVSNHASIAAAIPAILLFRLAVGMSNKYARAALFGVAGSFVLTAVMPIVSPMINKVRN